MKTKKISPLNYAFAIGKIRALEKFLIRSEVFQEAIEASLQDALRLFVESDLYSEELLHIRDSQHLEEVLNQEMLEVKNLIKNLLLDKQLLCLIESNSLDKIKELYQSYSGEFLQDCLGHLMDMHNIKTFLRLYVLGEPQEKLENILTCEGFIKKDIFLKLYSQDLSVFLNHMEYVHKRNQIIDYAVFLREPVEKLKKENSFVSIEKAINDFLMQTLKPAKYISFGPEPLIVYYFAKANEINLIRLIVLAKLNNVSADLVKERLNVVYA
jgi:vacuolar-type H+-ATPase subunit C/Vma6